MSYPYYSLTPEREKELIEKIARYIVDNDAGMISKILLQTYGATNFLGQFGFIYLYPFTSAVLGQSGQEYTELLGMNAMDVTRRIVDRVEELEAEKELKEEREKRAPTETSKPSSSSLSRRLSSLFSRKKDSNKQD